MNEVPKLRERLPKRKPRLLIPSLLIITSMILAGCANGDKDPRTSIVPSNCQDWMVPINGDTAICPTPTYPPGGQDPKIEILQAPTETPFPRPDISTLKGVGTALDPFSKCPNEIKPGDTLTSLYISIFGEEPPIGYTSEQLIQALVANGGVTTSDGKSDTDTTLTVDEHSGIKAFDKFKSYCPADPNKLNYRPRKTRDDWTGERKHFEIV